MHPAVARADSCKHEHCVTHLMIGDCLINPQSSFSNALLGFGISTEETADQLCQSATKRLLGSASLAGTSLLERIRSRRHLVAAVCLGCMHALRQPLREMISPHTADSHIGILNCTAHPESL